MLNCFWAPAVSPNSLAVGDALDYFRQGRGASSFLRQVIRELVRSNKLPLTPEAA